MLTACGGTGSANSAEAARADSSAAGYAVGERSDSGRTTSDTVRAVVLARMPNATTPGAPAVGTVRAGGTTGANAIAAGSATGTATGKQAARGPDTVHTASATNGRSKPAPPNVVKVRGVDSAVGARLPTGPVRVNEFLTYDARSRTVSLQLIAGYNGLNGSLNYNGATHGSHGISVPVGWRIHVAVANRDSDLQHSAIVMREVLPPPIEPSDPAFDGAALPQLDEGLHEDETGTLDFVADHAGQFMIACGVAGHAQAGMWLQLAVVKDAPVPAYR